jgi:hypothetical protein
MRSFFESRGDRIYSIGWVGPSRMRVSKGSYMFAVFFFLGNGRKAKSKERCNEERGGKKLSENVLSRLCLKLLYGILKVNFQHN